MDNHQVYTKCYTVCNPLSVAHDFHSTARFSSSCGHNHNLYGL